jgi:hypothetical protein
LATLYLSTGAQEFRAVYPAQDGERGWLLLDCDGNTALIANRGFCENNEWASHHDYEAGVDTRSTGWAAKPAREIGLSLEEFAEKVLREKSRETQFNENGDSYAEAMLSRFVLDASVVLTWCFPDEQSQKAEVISERIAAGDQPAVTALRPHEVLNALLLSGCGDHHGGDWFETTPGSLPKAQPHEL